METITSRSNDYLKYIRKIRDGKIDDKFFVEGKRLTAELADSPVKIESVVVSSEALSNLSEVLTALEKSSVELRVLGSGLFPSISQTKSPQGIGAVCSVPENGTEHIERSINKKKHNILVMLQHVSNPGNLGSVIRTCEATGVAGVIVSRNSANPFSPSAVRGSMGSVFREPLWLGTEFETVKEWAVQHKFVTISTDAHAERPYTDLEWNRNLLFVFGSEAHGLDVSVQADVDEVIGIPMIEKIESLNLAVAAGVILYEAVRNR